MQKNRIQTQRLDLVLPTIESVFAQLDAMTAAEKEQLSENWLELVRSVTEPDPWIHGFAISSRADDTEVGQCGFKGPPNSDGMVEIAYAIHPEHQGNGYATEAAGALVEFAFSSDEVNLVLAHTHPETNASTRILTKCGFENVGEVIDPDDGLVWRWQTRNDAN